MYKPDQEFASTCDRVLGPQSTQDDVYQHVRGGPRDVAGTKWSLRKQ